MNSTGIGSPFGTWLTAAVALIVSGSFSQSPWASEIEPVVEVTRSEGVKKLKAAKSPGGPLTIDFGDGRIAEVRYQPLDPLVLEGRGQLIAASCGDAKASASGVRCLSREGVIIANGSLYWASHPDQNQRGERSEMEPSSIFISWGMIQGDLARPFWSHPIFKGKALRAPELSCDDWRWSDLQPGRIQFLEITGQAMAQNEETRLPENHIGSAVQDVGANFDGRSMRITSAGVGGRSDGFLNLMLFQGSPLGFSVARSNDQTCEFSLDYDFSAAVSAIMGRAETWRSLAPLSLNELENLFRAYRSIFVGGDSGRTRLLLKHLSGSERLLWLMGIIREWSTEETSEGGSKSIKFKLQLDREQE